MQELSKIQFYVQNRRFVVKHIMVNQGVFLPTTKTARLKSRFLSTRAIFLVLFL